MNKYFLKKLLIIIGIVLSVIVLITGIWVIGLKILLTFQKNQNNIAVFGTLIATLTTVTTLFIEIGKSIWKNIERESRNRNMGSIIEALCVHPNEGLELNNIMNLSKLKMPYNVLQNLISELILSRIIKVEERAHKRIFYILS